MRTDEFTFELPPQLIAQRPPERRGASRLLDATGGRCEHRSFADLPNLLQEHDLWIRTIPGDQARFCGQSKAAAILR
jgi:S-adenosylmethionine:tRNA ribosyltransferase-isomerase